MQPFDCKRFQAVRCSYGCTWGELAHYSADCASTNDAALAAARMGEGHGTLFVTDYQHAGRGQHGRSWLAAPNQSLLFSVLLRPSARLILDSTLTLAVGLGARAALAALLGEDRRVRIKWPNDIWIDEKKVCGILCEAQASGGRLQAVAVGVGVNVFDHAFAPELASSATSLSLCGANVRRELLLAQVLAEIERRVQSGPAGAEQLTRELNAHDALRDRSVRITTTQGEQVGIARGIDPQGRLVLETASGPTPVVAGTVQLREDEGGD